MIVSTRNKANARSDPLSVSFGPFFDFFFVTTRNQDGNAAKSMRMKSVLFNRVKDVEVNTEKSLPFKNGVTIQKTFAKSNPCFLHQGILTERHSVSKDINSSKHCLMVVRQNPFPVVVLRGAELLKIFELKVQLFAICIF